MDDQDLKRLLGADEAPAHDPVFALAVLARIERQRFWRNVLGLVPVSAGIGLIAWSLAPLFDASLNTTTLLGAMVAATAVFMTESWQSQS